MLYILKDAFAQQHKTKNVDYIKEKENCKRELNFKNVGIFMFYDKG